MAANELRGLDAPRARVAMQAVAEHALARGDLLAAAHAYLNIAWLVQSQRHQSPAEVELVRSALEKAELIVASQQLTEAERASLFVRLESFAVPLPDQPSRR